MNILLKRISISVISLISIFGIVSSSYAIELDDASRTVALNSKQSVTLSTEQVKRGKRLFLNTCAICHAGGVTKTNPNVGLDTEALSLATPQRNTIEGLVDYIKNPTTFGFVLVTPPA
jgi:photosystem II cytochrome c550